MMTCTRTAICAACAALWIGQIGAQQTLPGTPAGGPAPQLEKPQQKVVDAVSDFFKRVRQNQPGQAGTGLDRAVQDWAGEVRTIRVIKGEKIVPRTYPAGSVETVPDIEDRQVTRIYFGPFLGVANAGTKGEYDPQYGTLKLHEGLVTLYTPSRTPTPKYGAAEMNIREVMQRIEVAQTVYHEFHHSTQGRQPGSKENETLTYHATLNTTADWVQNLENDYRSSRTLENARYLLGAIDAWNNYRTTVVNLSADTEKVIEKRPLSDTDKSTMDLLRAEIAREHQAIELLEGLSGTSPIPGTALTLDDMLRKVQATSLADLEKKLFDVARQQVDQGVKRNKDGAYKDKEATRQAKDALPIVQRAWEAKVAAVARLAKRLTAMQLQLSTSASDVPLDAKTLRATIRAKVDNNPEYVRLVRETGQALKTACGTNAQASVKEKWSVTDLSLPPDEWKGQGTRDIPVDKAQKYEITLSRTLDLGSDFRKQGVQKTYVTNSSKLTVSVLSVFPGPQELAGVWRGTLTIVESPYLDALANAPAPEESAESESCQQLTVNFGPALQALKGTPLELMGFTPSSETNGDLALSVKAPDRMGGKQGEPQHLPYRYEQGKLTVNTLAQKELRIKMQAALASAGPNAWTFQGTWEGMADVDGRTIAVMSGVWKGHKP